MNLLRKILWNISKKRRNTLPSKLGWTSSVALKSAAVFLKLPVALRSLLIFLLLFANISNTCFWVFFPQISRNSFLLLLLLVVFSSEIQDWDIKWITIFLINFLFVCFLCVKYFLIYFGFISSPFICKILSYIDTTVISLNISTSESLFISLDYSIPAGKQKK